MRLRFIPSVKHSEYPAGSFALVGRPTITFDDKGMAQSVAHIVDTIFARTGSLLNVVSNKADAGIRMLPYDPSMFDESYTLVVHSTGITIAAKDSRGAFYGLVTLSQVIAQRGMVVPFMRVEDQPDMPLRGYYYDVSRGKVPTLETMKLLARTAAAYKLNHLELYVEHTFAFPSIPEISIGGDVLTAQEILELDRYCSMLHIDLVPSLATFGHMHDILTTRRFAHLREVEQPSPIDWLKPEGMGSYWFNRMMHHTIDVSNDETYVLLQRMLDDFLPLFSSKYFNICGDETFDLGNGKNRERADAQGKSRLYLGHILRLHKMTSEAGRTMMMWGDIILNHPELLSELPKDIVLLNWEYSSGITEDHTARFAASGYAQCICPGVSTWGNYVADINCANDNIRKFAGYGKAHGAFGMLNTDWGDWGHLALFAHSYYGLAYGAGWAWGSVSDLDEFEHALSVLQWGDVAGSTASILRDASRLTINWNQLSCHAENLIESFDKNILGKVLDRGYLEESLAACDTITAKLEAIAAASPYRLDYRELIWGVRASKMNAHRYMVILAKKNADPSIAQIHRPLFKELCVLLIREYKALWRARNKESELGNIVKAFSRAYEEIDTIS